MKATIRLQKLVLVPFLWVLALTTASAATFTVTDTADLATSASLRRAISDANASPGPDVIVFQFPSASYPVTLNLSSALPPITEGVVIDATDGGACKTGYQPRVQFDGAGLGQTNGLTVQTLDAVTIKGLAIYRFGGAGIRLVNNQNSIIVGNYLGMDIQGLIPSPGNGAGIVLDTCAHVTIGGASECERNTISANQRGGVEAYDGDDHQILGNFIGIRPSGTAALPNQFGVGLFGARHCQVGSTLSGEANVISGNQMWGAQILGPLGVPQMNTLEGNFIGTGLGGSPPLPNGADGVYFFGGPTGNLVHKNTIRFNGGDGVLVLEGIGNTIVENTISDNVQLGIDISPAYAVNPNDGLDPDAGPNRQQNFPDFYMCVAFPPETGPGGTRVRCMFNSEPLQTFEIHYYWSPACDPSGYGEGRHYLGKTNVTTDALGNTGPFITMFPDMIPVGTYITTTATHPDGSTSEFSACSCPVIASGGGIVNHAGLPHEPVGNATLTPLAGEILQVSGSAAGGSAGKHGVQIGLGRAQGWIGQFDQLRLEPGQTLELETDMPVPVEEPKVVKAATEIRVLVDTTPKLSALFDPSNRVDRLRVDEMDDNGILHPLARIPNGGSYPLSLCTSNGGLNILAAGVVRLKSGLTAFLWRVQEDGPGCGTRPPIPYPPKVTTFLVYPDLDPALPGGGGIATAAVHPCEPWPDCLIPGYILDIKVILDPGCLSCPDRGIRLGDEWIQQFDSLHQLAGDLNTIISWQGPQPLPWGTLTVQSQSLGGDLSLDLIPSGSGIPLPPPDGGPDPHLSPDFANAARYICLDLDVSAPNIAGGPAGGGIFNRSLQFVVAGPVRPKPGEPVQDKVIFRGVVRSWSISTDFSGSGATAAIVEAYLHGVRVLGPMPLEALQVGSLPNRMAASTSVSPTGTAGFALYWAEAVMGPYPQPWDELRISALSPANPLMWLSQVTIQGNGLERLEILGENTRPARPGPLSIARVPGAGLSLSYPTELGRPYQLEYKNSLDAPAWELLDSFLGDGSVRQVIDPLRPGHRYYRLGGL
jgi:parallel beta-helix repeat protein